MHYPPLLTDPTAETQRIVTFLADVFARCKKSHAVIAVSGGIDSSLSLTLLTRALSPQAITPILLPYGDQNMDDARTICAWNNIPKKQWTVHEITEPVDSILTVRHIQKKDSVRRGNCMARIRMILVYDIAKERNALVCGTENRSEKELGYFTRFGDEASDIEPLEHLWKTQIRQLASHLGIPKRIREKIPTAGLWKGQTDEGEFGFSYENADTILATLLNKGSEENIPTKIPKATVRKVITQRTENLFKQHTPYSLSIPHR